jgi:hypothetical protein
MSHRVRLSLALALTGLGLAACDEPQGLPPCTAELALYFASVPDGDIGPLSMGGVDFEVRSGEVAGYREGGVATLLLMNARLAITPPCAAAELELVLDDTQTSLAVEGYATPDASDTPVIEGSSWSAPGLEPEVGPYQRWRLPAPEGQTLQQVILSTAGQSGVSVLVKSIVFR